MSRGWAWLLLLCCCSARTLAQQQLGHPTHRPANRCLHPAAPRSAVLDTAGTPQLPALTGLSRLQRACFTGSRCCQPDEIQPEAASLPHGAWAASLRQLGAPYGVLLRSGQLLAAAGQLERLGVLGGDLAAAPDNASERFWRWCATHSPLRQLQVEAERDQAVSPSVLAAAAGLRDERPALRVQCRVDVGEFDEEFFYYLEDD